MIGEYGDDWVDWFTNVRRGDAGLPITHGPDSNFADEMCVTEHKKTKTL
jgi:hypothetical protein